MQKPTGGPAGAHIMTVGGKTYVYPEAAMPYVASGVLDEELFNVSELLADGYDDAEAGHLPLIVSYADARKQSVPAGASRIRTLASIHGAALAVDRAAPTTFWTSLTGAPDYATSSAKSLRSGIAKVWLDGKVKVSLADTTTQIGAPEVWRGGNTGQGVDVAVLDTGIDAEHPDLKGQVKSAVSFVPGQDALDRHGHGTHVASTIAGTGAASGGKEQGVAPGAGLRIGKVLGNDGSGQDSWIIAGMEWAAKDQHAKVINMSLGSDSGSDGNDVLSQAVNRLSADTGALFVVAAGNTGPAPYSVGGPGAADAALTVGAVDKSDRLATFSSRGPRLGDSALKPELTAPGVDVLAARSQYAPEGTGPYLTLSGTSQATPHVSGSAALLAKVHPDWTGAQLKDALVSTTKRITGISPYAGGSGRLDVARAVKSTVFATASAFQAVKWPYPSDGVTSRDVVYTNTGADPVRLQLSVDGQNVPAGLLTLSTSQVTVPAHGSAKVGVQAHLELATEELAYSAFLTATGPAGDLRTPIGVSKQSQRAKLSIDAKDRDGSGLAGGQVVVKDIKHDTLPQSYQTDQNGRLELTLRTSTYAIWMYADVRGLDRAHSLTRALLSNPEVVLSEDRSLTFDAKTLRKIAAVTPQSTVNNGLRIDQYRSYPDVHQFVDSYQLEWWRYDSVWATPTTNVTQGEYTFATRWRQQQAALTFSAGKDVWTPTVQSFSPKPRAGTDLATLVYLGEGTASDFQGAGIRGKVAVVLRNDQVTAIDQAKAAAKAGARQLILVNDGYGPLDAWSDLPAEEAPKLPVTALNSDEGGRLIFELRQGPKQVRLVSHPYPEYLYDLVQHHDRAIPRDPGYRPRPWDLARIEESFRDVTQGEALDIRYDLSPDQTWAVASATSTVRAQGKYTVWVSAGPRAKWLTQASVPSDVSLFGSATAYKPLRTVRETWFGGIQRPRFLSDNPLSTPPSRVGNLIDVFGVPAWGSGPHEGTLFSGVALHTELHQGTRLVVAGDDTLSAEVPPQELRYRLDVDAVRNLPNLPSRPYSPHTHTEWGFASAETDPTHLKTLPLIQLDYGVSTELAGQAHRRTDLAITPSHISGTENSGTINRVSIEVSYDDGASWRSIATRRSGLSWHARLDAPSKARYASLRTTAHDAAGNSVTQTIERAFGLT
ncbi:S8 family serine peptidase [Kribbella sp. NPDC051587]|uniref:S8 family serine peptidase n=1 Tax=Kribbella sp. NPDC051587 TaxID=3364119 RepID=UPI0037A12945